MKAQVEEYLQRRFGELEAADFQPIAKSPCLAVSGTLRAYRALGADDRQRFRRIWGQTRAGYWIVGAKDLSREDQIWQSRFA